MGGFYKGDGPIDRSRIADEGTLGGKTRLSVVKNNREIAERVRAVAERDKARREGYDSEVTVRRVDPASLAGCLCTRPMVTGDSCLKCGRAAA